VCIFQREILKKVKSQKVRKDFEYLSHDQILDRIAEMQVSSALLEIQYFSPEKVDGLSTHLALSWWPAFAFS
jgi:hypothetical protein